MMSRSPPVIASHHDDHDDADIEAYLAEEAAMSGGGGQQQQQQQQPQQQMRAPASASAAVAPAVNVNPWQQSQPASVKPGTNGAKAFQPGRPLLGRCKEISRSEIFAQTRTTMKVTMDKGGERTVNADGVNIKVAAEIEVGDAVKLTQTGYTQMEWTKVQPVAEKIRKKRKLFNLDALFAPPGLSKLYTSFPQFAWDQRENCETKALTQIVSLYKTWCFELFPKHSFTMLIERMEKLGHKPLMKNLLNDLRFGKEIDWELYQQENDNQGGLGDGAGNAMTDPSQRKIQLNSNAEEIFQAFTARPVKKSARADEFGDDAGAGGGGGENQMDMGDIGDDDDLMAALADKYSFKQSNAGGAASSSSAAAGAKASAVSAPFDPSTSIHVQIAAKKAYEAERRKREEELQASMERKYQEEAEMDVFARPLQSNNNSSSTHPRKKRRMVSDDEDEEEVTLQPLPSQADQVQEEQKSGESGETTMDISGDAAAATAVDVADATMTNGEAAEANVTVEPAATEVAATAAPEEEDFAPIPSSQTIEEDNTAASAEEAAPQPSQQPTQTQAISEEEFAPIPASQEEEITSTAAVEGGKPTTPVAITSTDDDTPMRAPPIVESLMPQNTQDVLEELEEADSAKAAAVAITGAEEGVAQ